MEGFDNLQQELVSVRSLFVKVFKKHLRAGIDNLEQIKYGSYVLQGQPLWEA